MAGASGFTVLGAWFLFLFEREHMLFKKGLLQTSADVSKTQWKHSCQQRELNEKAAVPRTGETQALSVFESSHLISCSHQDAKFHTISAMKASA